MVASTALPNETWLEIFSYCTKRDLKALRLTSEKKSEMLASKLLFTTAYVAAHRGVLDIFMKLTTASHKYACFFVHPVLCHCIIELLYDISYIETPRGTVVVGDGTHYRRSISGIYRRSSEDPRTHKRFEDQEQIQTKELFDCLKSAFSGLSHLKRGVVADLSRTSGLLGDVIDVNGCPLNKRILSMNIEGTAEPYDTGLCCFTGRDSDCSSHGSTFRGHFGGVMQLIRVLASSDLPSFDSLSLGNGTHSHDPFSDHNGYTRPIYGGISNWCLHPESGISFELRQNVLPRLRILDLTICYDTAVEPNETLLGPPRSRKTDLYILLDKASELEVLKLTGHVNSAHLNVHDVLPASDLSKLRVLGIKACEARFSELTDFFVHRKDCLRRIKLGCFNLLDGTLEELQMFMPLNLPETSLIWGFTWEHGRPLISPDDKIPDEGNWDNVLLETEHQYLDNKTGVWAGIDEDGSLCSEDLDDDGSIRSDDFDYDSGSDHEDIDLDLPKEEGLVYYMNSPYERYL